MAACLAAVLLIAAVQYAAQMQIGRSFARIEAGEARDGIERAQRALDAELHELELTAAGYAALWDESHEQHSFTRSELHDLDVDMVWLAGAQGDTTFYLGLDTSTADDPELSLSVTDRLERYLAPPAGVPRNGLLRMPDGLMAVAAVPIRRSAPGIDGAGGKGTALGTMVFGRYLSAPVIARLARRSDASVSITVLAEGGKIEGALPHAVAGSRATGSVLSATRALLKDMAGRPLALLSATVAHSALQAGKDSLNRLLTALLAGGALLVVMLIVLANRSWGAQLLAQRAQREQLHRQQRKLSRLAHRDSLTGLPNRRRLQRLLPRLLLKAGRGGSLLALLYLDLDHFKNVNDSFGHGCGDRLLAAVAQRLRAAAPNHLVVRMGGDEFVVVVSGLQDAEVASSMAVDIRAELATPLKVDQVSLSISSSIGISLYPRDGTDPEQLLKHADIALNHAKDSGRGNHQFYTPEMNARLAERLGLERALRDALNRGELAVQYQPCFDLQTQRPVSLEALLRWRAQDGHYIPPSRFIPIAEQSDLIIELGEWVLRNVCYQLAAWQREHLPLLPVSVNISVRQFERTPLASLAAGYAQDLGIDANLLHYEITESAVMASSPKHLALLQALRTLGSRILIDDFGTGYSNLSYLKHLPIDTLKIDRAFVRDMAIDRNDAAIVRAIVGVAKSLGLTLVAEGIESAEQLESLRRLGCEHGQGFYFSPALPAQACCKLLSQLQGPHLPQAHKLLVGSSGELESGAS